MPTLEGGHSNHAFKLVDWSNHICECIFKLVDWYTVVPWYSLLYNCKKPKIMANEHEMSLFLHLASKQELVSCMKTAIDKAKQILATKKPSAMRNPPLPPKLKLFFGELALRGKRGTQARIARMLDVPPPNVHTYKKLQQETMQQIIKLQKCIFEMPRPSKRKRKSSAQSPSSKRSRG